MLLTPLLVPDLIIDRKIVLDDTLGIALVEERMYALGVVWIGLVSSKSVQIGECHLPNMTVGSLTRTHGAEIAREVRLTYIGDLGGKTPQRLFKLEYVIDGGIRSELQD
jgi:hypothetical protein